MAMNKIHRQHGERRCVICAERYLGDGNNAQPIKQGRCCDACNVRIVIPKRIAALLGCKR